MKTLPKMPRTAEQVTGGHPDKMMDQIADAYLDATLREDPDARVAIEMLAKGSRVIIGGEVTSRRMQDPIPIVKQVFEALGYDADSLLIDNYIQGQSPDIAQGVDTGGAGDQGIMVGFASTETSEFLPREYLLATKLAMALTELRKSEEWLGADGKTQVTQEEGRIIGVVVAAQHSKSVMAEFVRSTIMERVIRQVLPQVPELIFINGTGAFTVGGPEADAGVVGRKIVADAYGPRVPVGGGAYSGKDPTKVDRSAAYMARHIAKNLVANKVENASSVVVKLAYSIGVAEPLMVTAQAETAEGPKDVTAWVRQHFPDLRPKAIIDYLGLRKPKGWCYQETASLGHYTRAHFPWERVVQF